MLLHGCYLLSEDRPIVSTADAFVGDLAQRLPKSVPLTVFAFHTWATETPTELYYSYKKVRSFSRKRLAHMCNSRKEQRNLGLLGRNAYFCHHNLFCDESKLVLGSSEKEFDAIYIAQMAPFKRVELAGQVERLRIVAANPPILKDKLEQFGVPNAQANQDRLNREEISAAIGGAHCGLALSAVEGGMLASAEYLLCGVPIVSTPSRGGRDAWYTERNHILCEPTIPGVSNAVRAAVAKDWDAAQIRSDAIARCREHREQLAQAVRAFGGTPRFEPATMTGSWFPQNFIQVFFLEEFLNSWNGSRFTKTELIGRVKESL